MYISILFLVLTACQETSIKEEPPSSKNLSVVAEKESSKKEKQKSLVERIRSVVKAHVSMPDVMAKALTVEVMPNNIMVGVKDSKTGICFVVAKKQQGWEVVHMGTAMPVNWTVDIKGEGGMLILAEMDNIRRWFENNCSSR